MPTPYSPASGSSIPIPAHSRLRKRWGIWIRMPAPSPCSGSAPVAPRWVRFSRIRRPWVTIWWLFWSLIWAMNPSPHASCS